MLLRVVSWNLFHGRAVPGARRSLLREFAATIAAWEWDVALLQEVPPWWPPALASAAGGEFRSALTSRNSLLPVRRFVAEHWPDAIKSNGGGANAILARASIDVHETLLLRRWPERRVVHGVRLAPAGVWVANLHATVHDDRRARADIAQAARAARQWAGDAPLVLGGDFNVREPSLDGLGHAAAGDVDHIFVRGLEPVGPTEVLETGALSDHVPVAIGLRARP